MLVPDHTVSTHQGGVTHHTASQRRKRARRHGSDPAARYFPPPRLSSSGEVSTRNHSPRLPGSLQGLAARVPLEHRHCLRRMPPLLEQPPQPEDTPGRSGGERSSIAAGNSRGRASCRIGPPILHTSSCHRTTLGNHNSRIHIPCCGVKHGQALARGASAAEDHDRDW